MANAAKGVGLAVGGAVVSCALAYGAARVFSSPPAPKPCPTERQRRDTFDGLAKKWDATIRFDEMMGGITRARRRMVQRAEGDVLEVAIGSARNLSYYHTGRVTSVTGIDFSRAMLEVADGKRAELAPTPLKLKLCSSHKIDFPDNSFDTVVDTFGVCSFESPVEALREMRRVVKDDGQVLLLEHGAASWELVQGLLNRTAQRHVERFGCYPNRDIGRLVREAGLYVAVEERKHFGSTYLLVCKKSAPAEDDE